MSRINPLAREVVAKIVYYGPGLSGKTTSLKNVYTSLPAGRRGEFISLATETERTIFFDFLPVRLTQVRGMPVRLQLYTVPGQIFYGATRKLVLNGADGVVFVADSQREMRDANIESLADLDENLDEMGLAREAFPHVLQYNKRDLVGLLSTRELDDDLNRFRAPTFETNALAGEGVMPALKEIIRLVIRSLVKRDAEPHAAAAEADIPKVTTGDINTSLLAAVSSAANEESDEERAAETASASTSFAPLWPDAGQRATVGVVEDALASGAYDLALITAAELLSDMLTAMPGVPLSEGALARATLLGLDGREYLQLCRLASSPSETLRREDALFALYMLASARFKLRG